MDGGYILAGYTESYGVGEADFWLVKTDSEGNKEWDRTFGGTDDDEADSVRQTTDGGYILAGYTESYGVGEADFWLVKTDSEGNKEWDRTFGRTNYENFVKQTSDGGYILAGYDCWLVKTDSEGAKQWGQTFNRGTARSVQQTTDGGYIPRSTGSCFQLMKTDSEGDKEWDRTFSKTGYDIAYSVKQTSDGGYILTGIIGCYDVGEQPLDFWLVKTDSEGNKQWDRTFGGTSYDIAQSVQQTTDGGYILAGGTGSYGAGGEDFWLIKVGGTPTPTETIAPTADICVESDPSGADVYLDGVYQGMTGPDYFHIYNRLVAN